MTRDLTSRKAVRKTGEQDHTSYMVHIQTHTIHMHADIVLTYDVYAENHG